MARTKKEWTWQQPKHVQENKIGVTSHCLWNTVTWTTPQRACLGCLFCTARWRQVKVTIRQGWNDHTGPDTDSILTWTHFSRFLAQAKEYGILCLEMWPTQVMCLCSYRLHLLSPSTVPWHPVWLRRWSLMPVRDCSPPVCCSSKLFEYSL